MPSPNGSSVGAKLTKASKAGIDFDAEVSLATRCRLETADFLTSMLKPIVWVASVYLR